MENFQEFPNNDGLFKMTVGRMYWMGGFSNVRISINFLSTSVDCLGQFFAMPTDAIYHLAGHKERQLALASEPCLFTRKHIYIYSLLSVFIYTHLFFDCLSRTIHLDRFKWDNVWYT